MVTRDLSDATFSPFFFLFLFLFSILFLLYGGGDWFYVWMNDNYIRRRGRGDYRTTYIFNLHYATIH